jgi:hypothetical protein
MVDYGHWNIKQQQQRRIESVMYDNVYYYYVRSVCERGRAASEKTQEIEDSGNFVALEEKEFLYKKITRRTYLPTMPITELKSF